MCREYESRKKIKISIFLKYVFNCEDGSAVLICILSVSKKRNLFWFKIYARGNYCLLFSLVMRKLFNIYSKVKITI